MGNRGLNIAGRGLFMRIKNSNRSGQRNRETQTQTQTDWLTD